MSGLIRQEQVDGRFEILSNVCRLNVFRLLAISPAAAENQDRLTAGCNRGSDVCPVITDYIRFFQVHATLGYDSEQETGVWLSAEAPILWTMRADQYPLNLPSSTRSRLPHRRIDLFCLVS
jgi:hypothetical protein